MDKLPQKSTKIEKDATKRPPNGFFVFCNTHRSIVSQNNRKLENRVVTKILGDWWALLGEEQKPFNRISELRKQQFYLENPSYKWYDSSKNRRPLTGRMPCTRLSSRKGHKLEQNSAHQGDSISPGKLADENEMGGLNGLISKSDISKRGIDSGVVSDISPASAYQDQDQPEQDQDQPEQEEYQYAEDAHNMDVDINANTRKPGSAYKRKTTVPRKNKGNDVVLGTDCNEIDVLRALCRTCPIYSYADYIRRKEAMKTVKKPVLKRRRRRGTKPTKLGLPTDGTLHVAEEHEADPHLTQTPVPTSGLDLLLSAAQTLEMN